MRLIFEIRLHNRGTQAIHARSISSLITPGVQCVGYVVIEFINDDAAAYEVLKKTQDCNSAG